MARPTSIDGRNRIEEDREILSYEQLYRVEMPYFVCGLVAVNGWVVEAAPIMRWAKGKQVEAVEQWIKRKGGMLTLLEWGQVRGDEI